MQTQKKHEGIHIPRAKNYIPRFLGTCYLTRILTSAQCIFPVMCVLSCFSHVCLFVVLWTVAHQAPLCMGFSRQKYWSRLPFPSPGDLPNPRIEHWSPPCRKMSWDFSRGISFRLISGSPYCIWVEPGREGGEWGEGRKEIGRQKGCMAEVFNFFFSIYESL